MNPDNQNRHRWERWSMLKEVWGNMRTYGDLEEETKYSRLPRTYSGKFADKNWHCNNSPCPGVHKQSPERLDIKW